MCRVVAFRKLKSSENSLGTTKDICELSAIGTLAESEYDLTHNRRHDKCISLEVTKEPSKEICSLRNSVLRHVRERQFNFSPKRGEKVEEKMERNMVWSRWRTKLRMTILVSISLGCLFDFLDYFWQHMESVSLTWQWDEKTLNSLTFRT